jgi:hypothetical protein
MATSKKPATPAVKAARPKVEAKSTAQDVKTYRVAGTLHIDGLKLLPGDEVELTDYQAASLEGFVELLDAPTDSAPTE